MDAPNEQAFHDEIARYRLRPDDAARVARRLAYLSRFDDRALIARGVREFMAGPFAPPRPASPPSGPSDPLRDAILIHVDQIKPGNAADVYRELAPEVEGMSPLAIVEHVARELLGGCGRFDDLLLNPSADHRVRRVLDALSPFVPSLTGGEAAARRLAVRWAPSIGNLDGAPLSREVRKRLRLSVNAHELAESKLPHLRPGRPRKVGRPARSGRRLASPRRLVVAGGAAR